MFRFFRFAVMVKTIFKWHLALTHLSLVFLNWNAFESVAYVVNEIV